MVRKWWMTVCVMLLMTACAAAQESQSVLVNKAAAEPVQPQAQVQETQVAVAQPVMAQPTWLIRRGLFGWRAEPVMLQPVQVVVVQRPHVVWTPTIIWK